LSSSVFKDSDKNYVLQVLSLPAIIDVTYDQIEMRILLPEGAKLVGESGIKLEYQKTVSKEFTYFDFLGRPVISLSMRNMIPEAAEYLKVEYTYSSMLRYQKHVVVALALLIITFTVQLLSQIDLGNGTKKKAA
jgi:oligosaccharyltransferase complex subunit alpha (ribophorin I)